jgi:hypothetical protein
MPAVALCGLLLVVLTTVIHYEVLRALSFTLPRLSMRSRAKLLIVIFAAFISHGAHILLYGVGFLALAGSFGLGQIGTVVPQSLTSCLYFSAETYTSLGFGDVVPLGPLRLLAGAEALNGLLLIGWSASYTYLSMERFWSEEGANGAPR